tara:strand:- start:6568 stop:7881 length:1314 start_codon:yes stop_codon:yes gene_type:complete
MALGSQQANVDALTGITGLVHEIFVGDVLPGVRWESPTAQLYMNAQEGDYRYDGESLNGATDLQRPVGAQGSNGMLPDAAHTDAANWQTTPVRRYVRRAVDNYVEAAATRGPGSFADLSTRLFDQMWGAFRLMEIRHAIGGADGILCLVSSKTSTTVWVAKDGYNHTSTNPCMLLDEGMVICHHSSDGGVVEGAGAISSIAYSTSTVTMAAAWEQVAAVAAGDLVCAGTTTVTTTDYFISENNLAKNGQADIIDPDANLTTVFNIAEGTFARWRPFRKASATFDHIEITEFMQKLAAKSTYSVTPDSHTAVMSGGVYAELARSLVGFQQQQQLGKTFEGGYQAVRISGHDIVVDDYQLHDVMSVYCTEDLYTVSLVEAGYFDEDGSMYERISDFDGKEWYVRDYCNSFTPVRNRCGALTGIATPNVTDDDFTPTPDY